MIPVDQITECSTETQHAIILIGIGQSLGVQQAIFMEDAERLLMDDPDASLFPLRLLALSRMEGVNRNMETAEQKLSNAHVEALQMMHDDHIELITTFDPREGYEA